MDGINYSDDNRILTLLRDRDEAGLLELERVYGEACRAAALEILGPGQEGNAAKCTFDAFLKVWNAEPARLTDADALKTLVLDAARGAAVKRAGAAALQGVMPGAEPVPGGAADNAERETEPKSGPETESELAAGTAASAPEQPGTAADGTAQAGETDDAAGGAEAGKSKSRKTKAGKTNKTKTGETKARADKPGRSKKRRLILAILAAATVFALVIVAVVLLEGGTDVLTPKQVNGKRYSVWYSPVLMPLTACGAERASVYGQDMLPDNYGATVCEDVALELFHSAKQAVQTINQQFFPNGIYMDESGRFSADVPSLIWLFGSSDGFASYIGEPVYFVERYAGTALRNENSGLLELTVKERGPVDFKDFEEFFALNERYKTEQTDSGTGVTLGAVNVRTAEQLNGYIEAAYAKRGGAAYGITAAAFSTDTETGEELLLPIRVDSVYGSTLTRYNITSYTTDLLDVLSSTVSDNTPERYGSTAIKIKRPNIVIVSLSAVDAPDVTLQSTVYGVDSVYLRSIVEHDNTAAGGTSEKEQPDMFSANNISRIMTYVRQFDSEYKRRLCVATLNDGEQELVRSIDEYGSVVSCETRKNSVVTERLTLEYLLTSLGFNTPVWQYSEYTHDPVTNVTRERTGLLYGTDIGFYGTGDNIWRDRISTDALGDPIWIYERTYDAVRSAGSYIVRNMAGQVIADYDAVISGGQWRFDAGQKLTDNNKHEIWRLTSPDESAGDAPAAAKSGGSTFLYDAEPLKSGGGALLPADGTVLPASGTYTYLSLNKKDFTFELYRYVTVRVPVSGRELPYLPPYLPLLVQVRYYGSYYNSADTPGWVALQFEGCTYEGLADNSYYQLFLKQGLFERFTAGYGEMTLYSFSEVMRKQLSALVWNYEQSIKESESQESFMLLDTENGRAYVMENFNSVLVYNYY